MMSVIMRYGMEARTVTIREPVYVRGEVNLEDRGNGNLVITGKVIFPGDDSTIADRSPIVNSGSAVFAAWNLTGVGAEYLGAGRFIAQRFSVESRGIMRPGEEIDAVLTGRAVRKEDGRFHGTATIVFIKNNEILTRIAVHEFTELHV